MDANSPSGPARPGPQRPGVLNGLSVLTTVSVCLMMAVVGIGLVIRRLGPANPEPTVMATTAPSPTATVLEAVILPTWTIAAAPILTVPAPTAAPTIAPTLTTAPTDPPAATPAVQAGSGCTPPEGWELHHVRPGETLFAYVLGAGGTLSTDDIMRANCLNSDLLQIDQPIYLPPGAAENAPSSDPVAAPGSVGTGPRTPDCVPHCTISIRPGWRMEQIAAAIDTIPVGFWGADFLAAVGPGAVGPGFDFLATRPPGQSLEGFLYPGTYELSNADTPESFRDMLLAAFAAHLPAGAEAAAAAHGLTLYEAVILASIIQRESWTYTEQVLISSVFHNRLRNGSPLGSTVTTMYALGGPGNWWPQVTGNQINTASPYNTNLNSGLPPSPINSPSAETLSAALNPADTDYLFFTGNCRGPGNVYATTYAEHLANVNCE